MKEYMFSAEGREFLEREYVRAERSTYDIADELGTYPNMIRRALLHHGIAARDKPEAQEAALRYKRAKHPTGGRKRSEPEREKISKTKRETRDAERRGPDYGPERS